jgi:hypothetical protein
MTEEGRKTELEQKKEYSGRRPLCSTDELTEKQEKKEHYYRRRTRIAMPFLIITIITSRAVRSYDHVSRISYSGVSVKGLF